MDMERGAEGEGRYMKRIRWKRTIPYVKEIINGNLLYYSENSNRGSVTT